ncbi:MAG: NADH-quinone oxidoreductase subunit L [Actinomycetota bacterium]|nr:NADH-quinone oxidoreductase subunit L [Actinomycetota bacterium]
MFLSQHGEAVLEPGLIGQIAWLVPFLPFLAFFVILFFGKRLPDKGHSVGIGAVAIGLVISLLAFIELAGGRGDIERSWTWFEFSDVLELEFGMKVDFLTAVMFVVVCTISLLVQIYSTGYMHGDSRYTWFFAVLSMFTSSMLFLVIANNLMQMFVGWEGVGICSYFLIGHFWEEKENSSAAIKAFITTRIGDVGFLFGIFALFAIAHTFNITELNHAAEEGEIGGTALTVAALLLFLGAVGKSAQFPLHVWLPDAMAGPTPVSALIHAATMVVAGIYLVARMFVLFEHAGAALDVVAIVAGITMLIAAVLALVQDDIKKVLAYSTISQLGYMMAALGVGAYTASIFHLFTHAFFKALLFLGAGSLIHAVHSNNMSDMGGLRKYMPHTYKTFLIGSLALGGIFPFAGFWSKDEIVGEALRASSEGTQAAAVFVFAAAIITAFLTALYMTRVCVKTFWGEYRGHGHPHESPGSMVTPLWVLALATCVVGFLGVPIVGPFLDWIFVPGEEHAGFSTAYNIVLPIASVGIAGLAIWLGLQLFYKERWQLDVLKGPFAWSYRFVANKYYLDNIYLSAIVKPIQYPLAKAAYWSNQHVLDGVVNGTAAGTVAGSRLTYAVVDQGIIDFAVNGSAGLTGMSGGLLRYVQTGNIQRYAAVLFASAALFVGALAFF